MLISPNYKGLTIIPEFLSKEEEEEILKNIVPEPKNKFKGRNSIKRYGSNAYDSNIVSETIPDFLDKLAEKLVENKLLDVKPKSISINEYLIGNDIIPHTDNKASGPVITILSLLGSCFLQFYKKSEEFEIEIPPRSILQMRDEIRYDWKHGIKSAHEKRYSIVFRQSS